ncbi:hypothetical protein [Pseudomonas juntendi]|uniref:hypothetical protein n=1 Tax=Pseudomonas juntendi TaxID=2666183 RepID=UPI001F1F9BD8|nr:hypothetical protein [Pseudomonas juntendi]
MTAVTYSIKIHDLHRVESGLACADEAVVAILDGGREVHRERFVGKCMSPDGYTRKYCGKPGLEAILLSGNCRLEFGLSEIAKVAPHHP